jgi:hypothetical protein
MKDNESTATAARVFPQALSSNQNSSIGRKAIVQEDADFDEPKRGYLNYDFRFPPPGMESS